MKKIFTYGGHEVLVDNEDYKLLKRHSWHRERNGYACTAVKVGVGKWQKVKMHRLILGKDSFKNGLETDHKNGNRLDNRKSNLRVCSHAENMMNKKTYKNSKSGYPGVHQRKENGRWRAYINVLGRRVYLGGFDSFEQAKMARVRAQQEHHGDWNRRNG